MDDIMESIEKKEIRPLFIKERIAVYVYCYSYKGTRQLIISYFMSDFISPPSRIPRTYHFMSF